jgi:hypothetical protein
LLSGPLRIIIGIAANDPAVMAEVSRLPEIKNGVDF